MIEAARLAAARADVAVEFIEGRFEDKAAALGEFDVVTIGRAIHWLDPEPAQKALDRVVTGARQAARLPRLERRRRPQPVASRLHAGAQPLEDRGTGL